MAKIGLVPAEFAALVLETLFTGISLVMYAAAIYVLIHKRGLSTKASGTPFNKVLFVVTILLLVAGVSHWVLDVTRDFNAFVYDAQTAGPLLIFENISDPKNVVRIGLYMFQILLVDCVMVYRLFLVFNRDLRAIVLPCLSTLAFIISGIGTLYTFSKAIEGTNVFDSICGMWIQSSFICSFATNCYACPMIGLRIWWTNRTMRKLVHHRGFSRLSLALQIIVESATIYAIFRLTTLVFYLTESNAQYPTLDATCPAVGIIFCLVTVRSELGLSHEGQFQSPSTISMMDINLAFATNLDTSNADHKTKDLKTNALETRDPSILEIGDGYDTYPAQRLAYSTVDDRRRGLCCTYIDSHDEGSTRSLEASAIDEKDISEGEAWFSPRSSLFSLRDILNLDPQKVKEDVRVDQEARGMTRYHQNPNDSSLPSHLP